jgi:hypothetical protein
MDDSTLSPLARSFRRHLRAENRATSTIETYSPASARPKAASSPDARSWSPQTAPTWRRSSRRPAHRRAASGGKLSLHWLRRRVASSPEGIQRLPGSTGTLARNSLVLDYDADSVASPRVTIGLGGTYMHRRWIVPAAVVLVMAASTVALASIPDSNGVIPWLPDQDHGSPTGHRQRRGTALRAE